jgi:hypothetical protein
MTLYTVNAPPPGPDETAPDPGSLVFVKEGFSWPALLLPEIWLIWRRMWLVLLLYVAVSAAFIILAGRFGDALAGPIFVLCRFLLALEANGLRRWTLERNGYGMIGVAEGRGLTEAELRFFSEWSGAPPAAVPSPAGPPPPPAAAKPAPAVARPEPWQPTPENGGVVGLFPAPGGGG